MWQYIYPIKEHVSSNLQYRRYSVRFWAACEGRADYQNGVSCSDEPLMGGEAGERNIPSGTLTRKFPPSLLLNAQCATLHFALTLNLLYISPKWIIKLSFQCLKLSWLNNYYNPSLIIFNMDRSEVYCRKTSFWYTNTLKVNEKLKEN